MEQNWENKLIAKVILFSAITALATVIWCEVLGVEMIVIIVLIITGFILRRCIWKHYHT